MVSGVSSGTSGVSHISADNLGTIVVIPEVVRGKWSPDVVSASSLNPTFSGISEFFTCLDVYWSPWFS